MAADNTLEILIRLKADLAAAAETAASLKELKRQAVAAGVATGDLDKQIQAAERSEASAAKKLADHAKGNTGHIDGLQKATGLLARQFGSLGNIFQSVFSLPALGITALAVGIGKAMEVTRTWAADLEAAALSLQKIEAAKMDAVKTAIINATVELKKFNEELAGSGHEMDTMKEHFDRIAAQRRAAGLPVDNEKEFQERSAVQRRLNAKAEAALAAKNDPKRAGDAEALQEIIKQETAKTEALQTAVRKAGPVMPGMQESEAGQLMFIAASKAAKELKENEDTIASARAKMGDLAIQQAAADKEFGYRSGATTSNATRVSALASQRRIAESATLGEHGSAALEQAQGIAHRAAGGKPVSAAEREFATAVATVGSGQGAGNSFQIATQMLQAAEKNNATRDAFLERILRALEASGGMNQGFNQRLSNLENAMSAGRRH